MTTRHTPLTDRQQAQAQAQATPVDFNNPPPVIAIGQNTPMTLSNDQFKELIGTCRVPDAGSAGDSDAGGLNAVAVKLPTFWMHDPELWFLQPKQSSLVVFHR